MFNDLREYKWGNDEALLSLGLVLWEEPTTDCVREMHFHRSLETSLEQEDDPELDDLIYEIQLCVRFTVYISDNPYVSTEENFDHGFEGVFLRIIDKNRKRLVTEFRTAVESMHDLRTLIASFIPH